MLAIRIDGVSSHEGMIILLRLVVVREIKEGDTREISDFMMRHGEMSKIDL